MSRLRLALFDVDGTLVDSQEHIKLAMSHAFETEGLTPPEAPAVLSIVGLSLPDAVTRLAPELTAAQADRMVAAYKDRYAALRGAEAAASSPLFPGARDCLEALLARPEVMVGVATGKSRRGLTHLLDLHGLTGRFDTEQVADDHPSKPNPAMVEAALRATGVAARDTVMIGDTSFDMEMGRAAGARCLGVAWGYQPTGRLLAAGADRMAQHFGEVEALLDELWESGNG